MSEERCEDCRFYKRITDGEGHCKRRSPNAMSWFPVISPTEWCGEFEGSSREHGVTLVYADCPECAQRDQILLSRDMTVFRLCCAECNHHWDMEHGQ